ncbi:MAG: NifU family protein [Alphaproteobacteria bacterium]|nr:NifU family protein [Alphaproteobacteria bacterium]
MFIQTEQTPNPASLKFLPGSPLLEGRKAEFTSMEEAERYSPLAERLLRIDGVTEIFIADDFVTVTKAESSDWDQLKALVMTSLMQHLTFVEPIVHEEFFKGEKEAPIYHDEITKQIVALLDERVRPAVAQDGGDIEFDSFTDGVLYLRMRGACAGCPSSSMTLKAGIENMMKHYIPEVQSVEAVS